MVLVEEIFKANPLLKFSQYTQIQRDILGKVGKEIERILDSCIGNDGYDAAELHRAYGFFWLWVLGAFEVTRTMASAKKCFKPNVLRSVLDFKEQLVILRAPFSKQELRGRRTPVFGELNIYGIDPERKDFSFEIEGKVIYVREVMAEFEKLMESINIDDVLMSHSSSYVKKGS
jgi:hypothetical protein